MIYLLFYLPFLNLWTFVRLANSYHCNTTDDENLSIYLLEHLCEQANPPLSPTHTEPLKMEGIISDNFSHAEI